jgi:hypothetical protein
MKADLSTKQPATTSNIYFSKPRWTFGAHFSPTHFLELPDELSAPAIMEGPFLYTSHTGADPIDQAPS